MILIYEIGLRKGVVFLWYLIIYFISFQDCVDYKDNGDAYDQYDEFIFKRSILASWNSLCGAFFFWTSSISLYKIDPP